MAGLLSTLKKKKDELTLGLNNIGKQAAANYKSSTGKDLNAANVAKGLVSDATGFLTAGNVGSKNVPTYRMADTALESGRVLKQAADNAGYKKTGQAIGDFTSLISGASRLTPGEVAGNIGIGDSNSRIKGTNRERTLQDIGQTAYGLALTAPLASGNTVATKAASVLKNTAFGTGLGATIGAVTAKAGERLKGAKEGALSGAKNSYLLPVTNAISNAAIAKVGKALPWSQLSKLSPEAIAKAGEATRKLAKAGQYGTAAKNALKVVGKSALVEGLKSPLETAAFSLDDKLRLNTDKTFSERYKERFAGDLAGNAIFGGGGAAVGQAGSLAKGMIDFNQNYKNGFVEGADGSKRTTQQYELKKTLENGSSKPIHFGRLSDEKFAQINAIREENGLQPIKNQELYVHPNVIEKLQSKRINIGKMTPDQVADVAYSALYNNNSKVLSTRFPHIQASTKFNSDGVTANTAYIGEYQGDGSVKSVYINDIGDINKQSLEGGGQPSSTRRLNGSVPSSTNLSDGQSVVNEPIISSNQAKVNVNQEQNSDTYWDSLTKQAENEGNIKIKGNATEEIPEDLNFDKKIQENLDLYNQKTDGKLAKIVKETKSAINPLDSLSGTDRQSFDTWRSQTFTRSIEANNLAQQVDDALGNPDAQTAWKITQYMQNPTEETAAALGLENPHQYDDAIADIRNIYNDLYEKVVNATGKETGFVENYVPQMWNESQEEIEQIARSAGIKPSWMNKRIIPDYKTGVELGLTPKYTHPGQLVAEYYTKSQKALANNDLINDLLYRNIITTGSHPKGWQQVNSETVKSGNKKVYAPKAVATVLNNLFGEGSKGSDVLDFTATTNRRMQNFALSGGVPGTPFNSFTIGQTIKEVTGGNPTAVRAFARSFSDSASEEFMNQHQPAIQLMAQNGINVNTGHNYRTEFENALGGEKGIKNKLGETFDKLFEEPTFNRFMPMKNVEYFETVYDNAIKNGQTEEVAAKTAADMTKSWMGLIDNYARNKKGQQAVNSIFFAPAYREGMLNFWANLVKAIPNITAPENRQFLKFGVGTAITYGLYNVANKLLTGHYMWENKSGKKLSLEIPENEAAGGETGRSLYTGILPSVATMPRNAVEIGLAMLQGDGDTVKQKLGSYFSMPVKLTSELVANQDYFGNPIRDIEKNPIEQAEQVGGYIAGDYLHPFIGAGIDLATGRRNKLETALKVAETPFYGSRSTETADLTKKQYQIYQNLSKQGNAVQSYAMDATELKKQKEAIKKGTDPNASWWDNLWGNNKVMQFVPAENADLRATQKSVIKDKIKQMDTTVSPEELSFAYLYDIQTLPTSNRYETAQKNSKLYGIYDNILNDEYLSANQKSYLAEQIRKDLGQSEESMSYYLKASAPNNNLKTLVVYDWLEQEKIDPKTVDGHQELMNYLRESRESINGKLLATDGVVDNLYSDGLISKEERKLLKNMDWDELKKDWKTQSSSSGSKSGKKSSSSKLATAIKNLDTSLPAIPTIRISGPSSEAINIVPIKIANPTNQLNLTAPEDNSQQILKIVS